MAARSTRPGAGVVMSATMSVRAPASPRTSVAPRALVVADASWYTTESLFSEYQATGLATLLLKCFDFRNALQRGWAPWSWLRELRSRGPGLWDREMVLPSGWMKTFPRLGMRPIARCIERWRRDHAPDGRFTLVITYPHYRYLREMLRPDQTVYLNIDDYSQYWPRQADRVRALERRVVAEADLTVCVSKVRRDELRRAVPDASTRIEYLSHGCPAWAIDARPSDRPASPPLDLSVISGPRLGYIGSLEDRVDWALLNRLAAEMPHASLVFIGKLGADGRERWHADRRACLARPNVRLLGWKPQSELAEYTRAFDVCLIPYRVDHPFNRVCNPTKLMDSMGTGRPIVATALPECEAHAERIDVADSHAEFVTRVRAIVSRGGDDGRASLRHSFARENSCSRVAERLLARLDQVSR